MDHQQPTSATTGILVGQPILAAAGFRAGAALPYFRAIPFIPTATSQVFLNPTLFVEKELTL